MNSVELTHVLQSDVLLTQMFQGVFPCDSIPQEPVPNSCFVANVDPSSEGGSHWVCFYNDSNKCYFFDSYGRTPLHHQYFRNYLEKTKYKYNTKRLQSEFSSCCGQYCIFYLMMRARGKRHREVVDYFSDNYEENDDAVTDWVNEHFDLSLDSIYLEFAIWQICKAEKSI